MIFSVVGNVGTGKTTLVRGLQLARGDLHFIEEVRSQFLTDCNSTGAFAFQNQVHYYCQCLEAAQESSRGKTVVQDRCVLDMHGVFSRRFHEMGLIAEREFQLLDRIADLTLKVDAEYRFIYLRSDCQAALDRIRGRNDVGDSGLSLDIVRELDARYEAWYSSARTGGDLLIDTSHSSISAVLDSTLAWISIENADDTGS